MTVDEFSLWSKAHEQLDDQRFKTATDSMNEIKSDLRFIRENHLHHMEKDMGALASSYAGVRSDMSWIRWLMMTALGIFMAGFGTLFFSLFKK